MATKFIKPMSRKNRDGVRILDGILYAGDQDSANLSLVPLRADDRAELLYRASNLLDPQSEHAATPNQFGDRVADVGSANTRIGMLTHNDGTGETVLLYGGVMIHFTIPTLGELVSALEHFEREIAQKDAA